MRRQVEAENEADMRRAETKICGRRDETSDIELMQ